MQFKVPQFLDIEDKIFGPFTFREFVYLVGGGGLCFVLFKLLGFYWGAVPIILIASFALSLTFYKPNNKPFLNMLEAGFNYFFQSKLYIWQRRRKDASEIRKEKAGVEINTVGSREEMARLGASKLRDLAWSLDVLDSNKHKEN